MRTNPTTRNRHSGRSGHADRKSYHKSVKPQPTIEESADRLLTDIRKGFAGRGIQRAASSAQSLCADRERVNNEQIQPTR